MLLERIVDTADRKFKQAWSIYEAAFPADERRDWNAQEGVMRNKNYAFFVADSAAGVQGLLAAWTFDDVAFIEHFAVREDLRGKGIGTQILHQYLKHEKKSVVLETERPTTAVAKRRIAFYKRLGFKLNQHDYLQPAYSPEKNPVPMFLMSYPQTISTARFMNVRRTLHTRVYQRAEPLIS